MFASVRRESSIGGASQHYRGLAKMRKRHFGK
jgi:hypothetical protein